MPESGKILVVALNPSIDVEWRVHDVRWQEKNSIQSERRWPGGKGVNVARWLRHLSTNLKTPEAVAPTLLLPLGGRNGEELAQGLKAEGLDFQSVQLAEETRANIIVTTAAGRQMRFNPAGPCISPREWSDFQVEFRERAAGVRLAIFSGSLPRDVPNSAYTELIRIATEAGVKSLLDCDGKALITGITAKPFLVKPNLHELEEWFGRRLRSRTAVVGAATAVSRVTCGWVFVSLGEAGGLLLNSAAGEHYEARARVRHVVNSVGAGDALLAGVARAIASGLTPEQWLQWGIACGSSAVGQPAGILPSATQIRRLYMKIRPKASR